MSEFTYDVPLKNPWTKTIAITSGKGGVGKTTITSNIALQLASQGYKVLIFDGDLGMANVDIMFGQRATKSILNVLKGECELKDIIVNLDSNIDLISGGSGLKELQNLSDFQRRQIIDQVTELPNKYDYLLIDTAPGIGDNVLYLNTASQEIQIVLTPDPSSLTDSYALIKVLHKFYNQNKFSIICNLVQDEAEALALYRRLSDVAVQFLNVSLDYNGSIPLDTKLRKATKLQQLVVKTDPNSVSSLAFRQLSKKLSGFNNIESVPGGLQFFWTHLFGVA